MTDAQGLVTLDLKRLAEIDGGRIGVTFAHHLRRIVQDIEDRPADDRPRELVLKLKMLPDAGPEGLLDGVKLKAQVTAKVPTHQSKTYDLGVRDGQIRFQPMSPTDHNAQPLPGLDEGDEEFNH